jgi:hypothetical protein
MMMPEEDPQPAGLWAKPSPLGYGAAMDSLGTVASPLLAGFAMASVIVVAVSPGSLRWPGVAMLGLAVAAVAFLGALETSFNAKRYLWSASDAAGWWPETMSGTAGERVLAGQQWAAFRRWQRWSSWSRRLYNAGLLVLLAGLSAALPPPPGDHQQAALRWAAAGVVAVALAAEVVWMVIAYRLATAGRGRL